MTLIQQVGINFDEPIPRFTGVPLEWLSTAWPIVVPILQKALDKFPGEMTLKRIAENLMTGYYQLWQETDKDGMIISIGITQMVTYDTFKAMRLLIVAGKLSENWHQYLDVISNWAEDLGCIRLETSGRLGWGKVAKQFGFKPHSITLYKDIETRH